MRKKYNREDVDFVISNYPDMANADIARHLGVNEPALRKLASRLGVKKSEKYMSNIRSEISREEFIVFIGRRKVFCGIGRLASEYCQCAASSITYAAQKGTILKGKYRVAYADDKEAIKAILSRYTSNVHTDTMDWPLWFFKAGIAPFYAHKFHYYTRNEME